MAGKPRSTWLCRLRGHKFIKLTLESCYTSDYCFRCGFNPGLPDLLRDDGEDA